MRQQKFDVTGMTCSACSAHVEKAVRGLDGVEEVSVNLLTGSMTVQVDDQVTDTQIEAAVDAAGYGATPHGQQIADRTAPTGPSPVELQIKNMKMRLWVSFGFLIPLMYISMGHMVGLPLPGFLSGIENGVTYAMAQFLLTLPVVYVNRKYYQVGFKTLFRGAPNMDSLIAIGSTAALVYGVFAITRIGYGLGIQDMQLAHHYHMDLYFESAAMILALITLGKYLEARSKGKTSEAITKLMDLAPKTATVERDGQELELPVEQVVSGDTVLVRPGQSVPVDGVILEGNSSLDEAAITGESIPVDKGPGDTVIGASINRAGFFKFRATKVGEDTTLSQIIRLVEDASSSKAPIAKLADKISGVFVPVVIGIALLAAVVWLIAGATVEFALSVGIAVLVISCPCALGLATPVAIMVGTGKGAENGILIKSGEALETAHSIDTVVMDKTGTITQGHPVVTDILPLAGQEEPALLQLAASLEKRSEHPLAQAILDRSGEMGLTLEPTDDFTAIFGKGLTASIGGQAYFAGNEALLADSGIALSEQQQAQVAALAEDGKTPLLFADSERLLGIIAVADTVKPTSAQAIADFRGMGIDVVMLTGDNARTAGAIQRQLDIPHVIAGVLPQQKEQEVAKLQAAGKKVAMVGDGINDAPALARADVGIAIGAGTDVAIESADVVLIKSDLQDAVTAVQLSKAVIRNIKQNLFWAFFYNSVGIPLAAGLLYPALGLKLSPMFGAAAMSLSSVCVVTNALRLRGFRPKRTGAKLRHSAEPAPADIQEVHQSDLPTQQEGESTMKKTIHIEGMMCAHCVAHVEKALNAIDGVQATVSLEDKNAVVELEHDVADDVLKAAVTDAGYTVTAVE